jgi:RNA polymerase sigma factor (sigma-70 family)
MAEIGDRELLREYAQRGSQDAFAEIVRRHLNLVYGVAVRQTGDHGQAQDIAQAVFTILARKAAALRPGTVLAGWLYQTARLASAGVLRAERRRRHHELESYMHGTLQQQPDDAHWEKLAPILDEAMDRLGTVERDAVLLHYFNGLSIAEAAAALEVNEPAFRKRVQRALEKLRKHMARRGIVVSAAMLAAAQGTHAAQAAPASLAAAIAAAAATKAAAGVSVLQVLNHTLKYMAWTKAKTATIAAIALVLGAGTTTLTFTALDRHGSHARVRVAPDGSFVRLLSVAVGTNFHYSVPKPNPWLRAIVSRLPSYEASRFDSWLGTAGGSIVMNAPPGGNRMAVFAATEEPRAAAGDLAVVVSDDRGNSSLASLGAGGIGNSNGRQLRKINCWVLQAFPRRTRSLLLRFVRVAPDQKSWRTMGEFHVANPFFAPYSTWTPDSLPITQSDGDLTVTLAGFTTSAFPADSTEEVTGGAQPSTCAEFHAECAGHPEQVWRPRRIEISDATGNQWAPYPYPADSQGTNELRFAGNLWPGESAWKMRVEFSKTSGFGDDELWTVRGLTIPEVNQSLALGQSTRLAGAAIRLVAFTAANVDQPGDFKWMGEKSEPRLSVSAEPPGEGWRLGLVKVVDDKGRQVAVHSEPDFGSASGEAAFGLVLPPGASSLDCTFAWRKSRFVEFTARPEIVPPQAAQK